MKTMFQYEMKKVIGQSFFIKFLLVILLINGCVVLSSYYTSMQEQGYYQEQFMSALEANEHKHQDEIEMYHETLHQRRQESEDLLQSSLFQVIQGGDEQYLSKKIEKLKQLEGIEIKYEDVRGADLLFQSEITYLLFLGICIMVGYLVFVQEEEKETLSYLHTMKDNHQVMVKKMICAILLSLGCGLFLFGTNYGIGTLLFGAWEPTTLIIQLKGMINSVHSFTIRHYYFFFGFGLLLFTIFLQSFLAYLTYRFKKGKIVFGWMMMLIMIETLFYYFIPNDSYLVGLKEINIIMYLYQLPMFQEYRTIAFLQHIDLYQGLTIIIMIVTILLLVLSVWAFKQNKEISKKKMIQYKSFKVHSLAYYEAYKLFWKQKGFLILILFMIFSYVQMKDFQPYIDKDTYYYQIYSKELVGECNQTKEKYIQSKKEYYQNVHVQLKEIQEQYSKGIISEARYLLEIEPLQKALYGEEGFRRVESQYDYVTEHHTIYVEESGYQYLYQEGRQSIIIYLMLGWFVLACILCNVHAIEKPIEALLNTSIYQQKKMNQYKYLYASICAICCYGIGVGAYLWNIIHYFQMDQMNAPLSSLFFLGSNISISIQMMLIILLSIGLLLTMIYTYLCIWISKHSDSSSKALITSFIIAISMMIMMIYLLY